MPPPIVVKEEPTSPIPRSALGNIVQQSGRTETISHSLTTSSPAGQRQQQTTAAGDDEQEHYQK